MTPRLLPIPVVIAWIALLNLAAWSAGDVACRRLTRGGPRLPDRATNALLSTLVGFALLAQAAFALGAARLLYAPLLVGIAVALAIAGAPRAIRAARATGAAPPSAAALAHLPLLLGVAFAATFLLKALDPVLEHDDNVYHLLLPKLYLANHALVRLPLNLFANMPHAVEVLYTIPMALGDYTAPKVLAFSFAIWTIVGIAAFVAPRAGRAAAGVAVLLFVSGKNVQWHLGLAYVEPVIGAFLLGGMLALLAWRDTRNEGFLWIVGIACGVAFAAKYSAWYEAGVLVLVSGVAALRAGRGRAALGLVATSVALVLPWLVKNALSTGNPIYPNLYGVFDGRGWSAIQAMHLAHSEAAAGGLRHDWLTILAIPLRLTVKDNVFYCPSASIALFALFAVAIARPSSWREPARDLTLASIGGFLAWACSVQQGRFLVAWVPVMTLAASLSLVPLARRPRALAAAAVVVVALAIYQIRAQDYEFRPAIEVVTRPRATLVAGNGNYALCTFLNERVPANGKVLVLWDNRFFFLERPFASDSVYEAPSGLAWLRRLGDAAAFARELAAAGYTHVVVYTTPFLSYINNGFRFDLLDDRLYPRTQLDRDAALVDAFVDGFLTPIHREGNHIVFELRGR